MEISIIEVSISLIAGLAAGLVFFAGLWITVKLSVKNPYSWLIMTGSYVLRFLFLLVALFAIAEYSGITGLLISTAGFIASKLMMIKFVKTNSKGL